MKKKYDFNQIINRKETNCIKYDAIEKFWGVRDAFPMWVADMDFKTPDFIIDAIKNRLDRGILGYGFKSSAHYKSIINWLNKRHNFKLLQNQLSSSPGVVTGFSMAIQKFTKPGDKIIVQPPVYFPFFKTVKNAKRQVVYNPLIIQNGKITIDFKDLENKASNDVKMLLLCNPHNPGGRAWTLEELKKIDKICQQNNIMVVSDEIHADILFDNKKYYPYAKVSEFAAQNSLTFGAPNKTFNIAGLSTSFVFAKNPEILKKYNEILELNHLSKGNIFGNIALTSAYEKGNDWLDQLIDYLTNNLNFIEQFFRKNIPQIKVYRPDASFLILLDCRNLGLSDAELKDFFFNKVKIILNPGYTFGQGGEGFMRMNFALPYKKLVEALEKIKSEVDKLKIEK